MAHDFTTKPARSGPPPLSRQVSKLMATLAERSGAMDPRLAADWPDIAGPQLSKQCRPVRLKKNGRARTLEIAAANGAAAMQLQYRQKELLEQVNRLLGKGAVTRIAIRQTGAAGTARKAGPVYSRPVMPDRPDDGIPAARTEDQGLDAALERLRGLLSTGRR